VNRGDQDLSDRDLRQRDVVPPERLTQCRAAVIGVGAVGRQVALQLAAIGVTSMLLFDHDGVDVVNLATQGFAPDQLGQRKVDATAGDCRRLNAGLCVTTRGERFRRSSARLLLDAGRPEFRLATFCCVDSITARAVVWESVRHHSQFFADARMTAEVVRVLASAQPADDEHYPMTLFNQGEAFAGACTSRSTIYCASIAAALMVSAFTRWLRDIPPERDLLLNLLSGELVAG
jgi:sulfur carrier protein ThiS adenylyltransferase